MQNGAEVWIRVRIVIRAVIYASRSREWSLFSVSESRAMYRLLYKCLCTQTSFTIISTKLQEYIPGLHVFRFQAETCIPSQNN